MLAVQTANQNAMVGSNFSLVLPAGTFSDVDSVDTLSYVASTASGSTHPLGSPSTPRPGPSAIRRDQPMSARDPGDGDRSRRPRRQRDFQQCRLDRSTSYSLFSPSGTPAQTSLNDGPQLEVGLKFQANVTGQITAFKFYRSPSDTGQNVVELWTATGTKLASASFTNTAASGWRTVALDACFHNRQHDLCRVLPHNRDLCCH